MRNKLLLAVFALLVFANIGIAQDMDKKMMNMKDDPAMAAMMNSQNHRVMMTYRQSLLNYATALRDMAKNSDNFNVVLAKALFEDIERSSRVMDMIHKDHMSKMDAAMKEKMAPMMKKMKNKKAELDNHIKVLGKKINASRVNAKEVEKHASAIVKMLENKKMDEKEKMKDGMNHTKNMNHD